jgi:Bacterial low temperature requirement A protein (LtrA)
VSDSERAHDRGTEHQVTPLELVFDLTFVFAITQATSFLASDPTWRGVFRGMLVLAALWWTWSVYAWLTSAMDVDEGGVRLVMLAATGGMFGVALAVPGRLRRRRRALRCHVLPRPPSSSRPLRHRRSRRSRTPGRTRPVRAHCDHRPVAARGCRLPRWASAHRSVARGACDRLPRPGHDRRGPRLARRAGALRRAARADRPDRARRVDRWSPVPSSSPSA